MPGEESEIITGSEWALAHQSGQRPDHGLGNANTPTNGAGAIEARSRLELSTILLLVICILLTIYALYLGRVVIIPLMVALLLKLVLSPVVRVLSSLRVPEWAGAALVLAAV